ncbi:MAG: DUF2760 domain-containing protein [Chitinophagaceae bacterium]|nr:DUF2760 domain-containing protein [Oligoflexus sp.]
MKSNANKLIYPTVVISAVAVMAAYLEVPIPSLGAAFIVFVLLLIQLAASRRLSAPASVPPEFQAKLASLENQNSRQNKELTDAQTEIERLKTQIMAFDASASKQKNEQTQKQSGGEQAVLHFVRNMQTRGRFLDFVMADIHKLPDAQVGAVSRIVHQGLRDLIDDYFAVKPIASESEGSMITIPTESLGSSYSLISSRGETIPGHGRLLHRGWQVGRLKLPVSQNLDGDLKSQSLILAAAEIDVSGAELP